jgi:hypothetical protein
MHKNEGLADTTSKAWSTFHFGQETSRLSLHQKGAFWFSGEVLRFAIARLLEGVERFRSVACDAFDF